MEVRSKKTNKKTKTAQQWSVRVKENLKLLRIRDEGTSALDRETWRGIVEAAMGLNGPE